MFALSWLIGLSLTLFIFIVDVKKKDEHFAPLPSHPPAASEPLIFSFAMLIWRKWLGKNYNEEPFVDMLAQCFVLVSN